MCSLRGAVTIHRIDSSVSAVRKPLSIARFAYRSCRVSASRTMYA